VPVILSSGFSETEATEKFNNYRIAAFLRKPYTAAQLVAAVRAALAASMPRSGSRREYPAP